MLQSWNEAAERSMLDGSNRLESLQMVNRTSQARIPWYRWRFSLPMILASVLFGWLAWKSLQDEEFSFGIRVRGTLVFAALASVFAWFEWRNRRRAK